MLVIHTVYSRYASSVTLCDLPVSVVILTHLASVRQHAKTKRSIRKERAIKNSAWFGLTEIPSIFSPQEHPGRSNSHLKRLDPSIKPWRFSRREELDLALRVEARIWGGDLWCKITNASITKPSLSMTITYLVAKTDVHATGLYFQTCELTLNTPFNHGRIQRQSALSALTLMI